MNSYLPVSLFYVFLFGCFFLLPFLLFLHRKHNLHNDDQKQRTAQCKVIPGDSCKDRGDKRSNHRAHRSDKCEYFLKNTEAVSFAEFPRSDAAALPDFLQMFVGSLCNSAWIAASGMDSAPTGYWCMYSCGRGFRLPGCRLSLRRTDPCRPAALPCRSGGDLQLSRAVRSTATGTASLHLPRFSG